MFTYQASLTFFVSGHAQQALHFGFSAAGAGGVREDVSVEASLVDALPISEIRYECILWFYSFISSGAQFFN